MIMAKVLSGSGRSTRRWGRVQSWWLTVLMAGVISTWDGRPLLNLPVVKDVSMVIMT